MLCKSIGYLSSQLTEPSMGHEEKEYDDVEGDYVETEKSLWFGSTILVSNLTFPISCQTSFVAQSIWKINIDKV